MEWVMLLHVYGDWGVYISEENLEAMNIIA